LEEAFVPPIEIMWTAAFGQYRVRQQLLLRTHRGN
jgi:hypothetical protein